MFITLIRQNGKWKRCDLASLCQLPSLPKLSIIHFYFIVYKHLNLLFKFSQKYHLENNAYIYCLLSKVIFFYLSLCYSFPILVFSVYCVSLYAVHPYGLLFCQIWSWTLLFFVLKSYSFSFAAFIYWFHIMLQTLSLCCKCFFIILEDNRNWNAVDKEEMRFH